MIQAPVLGSVIGGQRDATAKAGYRGVGRPRSQRRRDCRAPTPRSPPKPPQANGRRAHGPAVERPVRSVRRGSGRARRGRPEAA